MNAALFVYCNVCLQVLLKKGNKSGAGDHDSAKAFEVPGMQLAVDDLYIFFLQLLYITDKGELAGIAEMAEHAFAEKYIAQAYAVQSAGQPVIEPCFCAVCKACLVQLDISRFHFIGDPGAVLPFPVNVLTTGDHLFKSGVAGKTELFLFNNLLHAFADLYFGRK